MDEIIETLEIECPNCGQKETNVRLKKLDSGIYKQGKCAYCLTTTLFECIEPNPNFISTATIVHCPFCNSINCKKISNASKVASAAAFGVFSLGKVTKTWHCNSCGSNFG